MFTALQQKFGLISFPVQNHHSTSDNHSLLENETNTNTSGRSTTSRRISPIKHYIKNKYYNTLIIKQYKLYSMFSIVNHTLHEFNSTAPVWLLGHCYKHISQQLQHHPQHMNDTHQFNYVIKQCIVWLTYRSNMEVDLLNSGVVSDAGWGCMLRTGQMMLARALYLHLCDTQSIDYNKQY